MIRRFTRSLSLRLLAIFLVMGVLFAYGAILGIRWVYATDQLRELVSGHLSLHVDYVRNDIGDPPNIGNALEITRKVPVDIRITGPDLDWASDPAFPAVGDLDFGTSDIFSSEAGGWLSDVDGVEFARYEAHGILKIGKGDYVILVSTPKISVPVVERRLTPIIIGVGLVLVLLAYLAVRWLFKPITAIRDGAAAIGRGNFAHRIIDVRRDELGDLADDINKMAVDVEGMLDAKRQLLLGISHELRSPLSRMNLAVELAGDSGQSEGMALDIAEMEQIIASLLEAERLNTRHAALHISAVSAAAVVDEMIDNYFVREKDRIKTVVPDNIRINADEVRLTLMLKNLVSNALRYTSIDDGPVEIVIDTTPDAWRIMVRDRGPGIPDDQLPFIGEPFYRGDPSRTRHSGGSGLGLYLAKLVAQAHGGTLELDKSYTDGACFIVTLPFEPRHT